MSRIPLANLEQQPEPIRQWAARRGNLNVFRLLANAPKVFGGWTDMVDELFDSPTFSARMREVIIVWVAHLQESPYELGQHLALARTVGLTEQEIGALAGTGDLVATVPRRTARQIAATGEIAIMPLPIDFAMTVSMAWHRRAASDPAQAWFRSLLIEAAADR